MKKILTGFLLSIMAAGSALALDLELSGEIKTGFYAEQQERNGETIYRTKIFNNDEDPNNGEKAGNRIRVGLGLQQDNFGLRIRLYQEDFRRKTEANDPNIKRIVADYAYAYGSIFDNQLKISAGLLGESPWGSGGPELVKEVETGAGGSPIMGIRFEFKPTFLPFLQGLNIGFVLDRDNDEQATEGMEEFGDIFQESILGIAWEHEYFAFRFDREVYSPAAIIFGTQFVYRVEERALGKLLPGMQIWANGFCKGIGAKEGPQGGRPDSFIQNWLYIAYDPEYFSTGLNVGYNVDLYGSAEQEDWFKDSKQKWELRPYFYYKFLNNLLSVGIMGGMEIGVNGGKSLDDAFYNFWFLEPQVKLNIGSNCYVGLVYRYTSGEFNSMRVKDQETHWFNIRLYYKF